VLPGVVVVPGFGEAAPGVGAAVPGVGAAVPGVGEAVPEFGVLPVPVCPGFAAVPGACPLCEAEPVPDCPALDPAEPAVPAEPVEPADPDCATNQQLKSNTTNIIEIFVFMGFEASKKGVTPQFAFSTESKGQGWYVRIQWTP